MNDLSNLSNADLNRRIAEAQGWTWCEPYEPRAGGLGRPYGPEGAWLQPDGTYLSSYYHHPATDIGQATKLLESLPAYTEYRIEGSVDGREHTVLLLMARRNVYAHHPSLARAIAEAWLAAMQDQKARENALPPTPTGKET